MLGHLQRQKSHHYFDLIDRDEDGYINGKDFEIQAENLAAERDLPDDDHKALREQMLSWWEQLCASVDADDDNQISRSEWDGFWEAIQSAVEEGSDDQRAQMRKSLEQAGKVAFDTIDATGSGKITKGEYGEWLAAWDANGAEEAFKKLDREGTGHLSEDDLIEATKEFYLSNDADAPGNLLYGTLQ